MGEGLPQHLALIEWVSRMPVLIPRIPQLYDRLLVRFMRGALRTSSEPQIELPWRVKGVTERCDNDGEVYYEVTFFLQETTAMRAYLVDPSLRPKDVPFPARPTRATPADGVQKL